MSIRDDLRALAFEIRSIPNDFGLRPYTVAIQTGSWSGTYTGNGVESTTLIPITEANGAPPKVRWKTAEEIAVAGIDKGTIAIGPITPDFPGGGTTYAMIQPALAAGMTIYAYLTGPDLIGATKFVLTNITTDRGLHWSLEAKPAGQ